MLHIQYLNGKQQKWLNYATVTKIYFARIHSPALHNISFKKILLKKKNVGPLKQKISKQKKLVLQLLSASVERFIVCSMRDIYKHTEFSPDLLFIANVCKYQCQCTRLVHIKTSNRSR